MTTRIPIVEKILSANDRLAQENRAKIDAAGVFAINIMASPGAGKTSVILQTIRALTGQLKIAVVEGDTAPVTIDADKVKATFDKGVLKVTMPKRAEALKAEKRIPIGKS